MKNPLLQRGASLLEVLVAMLLLAFGMLALGVMLSFSVQLPKLAGYRATATTLASSHIERMRANASELQSPDGAYTAKPLSYNGTFDPIPLADCSYGDCTPVKLALMDNAATQHAVREALPAGGVLVTCDAGTGPCGSASYGNIWIVWQDPSTAAALSPASPDNCPSQVIQSYTNPVPHCLYVRFKI